MEWRKGEIIKVGKEIKHLEIRKEIGRGKVVDTAYRLEEGKIIYVLYMPVEYKGDDKR